VNDVKHIIITNIQNFFSIGTERCFKKTINPRIILARVNRIPRERSGGIDSMPIFTAAHDDPQMRQITVKPSNTLRRSDIG
jgi:hypothetical protein